MAGSMVKKCRCVQLMKVSQAFARNKLIMFWTIGTL